MKASHIPWALTGVAIAVAGLSAVSDHVGSQPVPTSRAVLFALAGVVNDFSIWFAIAIGIGISRRERPCRAISAAALWSVTTILLYLAISYAWDGEAHFTQLEGLLEWVVLAALGGAVGGALGAAVFRFPLALLPLIGLCLLRIRDHLSWQSSLGIAHNATLLFLMLAATAYLILRLIKAVTHPRRTHPWSHP